VNQPLRLLIVEDSKNDTDLLLLHALHRGSYDTTMKWWILRSSCALHWNAKVGM
jgi:hypothetical protein